jgi:TPR repeat protein
MVVAMTDRRLRWCGVACAIALAACTHPAERARVPAEPLAKAHAYERGAGVPRDYAIAVDLYRTACDQGRGNLTACGELIRAELARRGVAEDAETIRQFAGKLCLERRDPFGCAAVTLVPPDPFAPELPEPLTTTMEEVLTHLHPCDAAHPGDCWAELAVHAFHGKPALEQQWCAAGIITACADFARRTTSKATTGAPTADDALRLLQTACDAGDAEACEAAPDRAGVPVEALCAAHDYEACAALGCAGDRDAARIAASHGNPDPQCVTTPPRAMRADAARAALVVETEHARRVCACPDVTCLKAVDEAAKTPPAGPAKQRNQITYHADDLTSAEIAKFDAVESQLIGCATKLLQAAPPP